MTPRRITALFLLFGWTWILVSDRAIALFTLDADLVAHIQSVKGFVFVGLSALLIYVLTRRAQRLRSHLERQTEQQRDRLARILDVSPAVIYALRRAPETAAGWTLDFLGHKVEQISGYPVARWHATPGFWLQQIHPDDRERVRQAQATLQAQGVLRHEYRFRHANGSYRWIDDSVVAVRDAQGRTSHLVGAWLDVTDRKAAELMAHESEQRYRQLFDLNPFPMWVYDLDSLKFLAVNEAATLKYGYSREEFLGMTLEDIRPEGERLRLLDAMEALARGPDAEPQAPTQWLHRGRDGRTFRVEINGHSFVRDGRHLRLVLAHDISDRLLAEERSRLITEVFESSQEGIFITDAEARFISVNRTFSRVTGYALEEVLGRTPALLKSGRQDPGFYAAMWARIRADGRWEGEIWNRRKDGEIFPEWLTISAIKDEQGVTRQYLGLFTETSSRKAAEARIERLANYDSLTDLPSRALLADRARVALATAARAQLPLVVMHLNVDHFGEINEALGHEAGDQVLCELARRLTRELRSDATLSRLGGDDFIMLLPGTSVHEVGPISLRLLEAVGAPLPVAGQPLVLSACIGVAAYPDNGADLAQLTQAAEVAVHLAKREGRGSVHVSSPRMQQAVQESLAIARDLRWAVARGELVLHYQAQFDAGSRRLVGVEALVRWQHPEWGLVSPGRFIPIAEESGLIQPIGTWVLREALRQNAAWRAAGLPVVPVAVNLSVVQFRHAGLKELLIEALRESGLPGELLELELTESVAMEDSDYTIAKIASLKQLGLTLSLDDFGTGYSSLGYLKRFAVDKLKIDQSFVRGLRQDAQDEAIVTTVIGLARSLGLRTIAEGVETAEQLAFLRQAGCDEIQGYHCHRPAPAADFERLLRESLASRLAEAGLQPAPAAESALLH